MFMREARIWNWKGRRCEGPQQCDAGFTACTCPLPHGNNQLHTLSLFFPWLHGATSHKDTVRTKPLAYKRQGPMIGLLHARLCFWRGFYHLIHERGGSGGFVGRQPGSSTAFTNQLCELGLVSWLSRAFFVCLSCLFFKAIKGRINQLVQCSITLGGS